MVYQTRFTLRDFSDNKAIYEVNITVCAGQERSPVGKRELRRNSRKAVGKLSLCQIPSESLILGDYLYRDTIRLAPAPCMTQVLKCDFGKLSPSAVGVKL